MPRRKPQPRRTPYHLLIRLDSQDRRSLERLCKSLRMTRVDTVRQLIRAKDRNLKTVVAAH